MPTNKDIRRHARSAHEAGIRVTWSDSAGSSYTALGRCLDVSSSGVGMEIPDPVPVRNPVNFQFDRNGIQGSGSVRYSRRRGMKYLLGIELGGALRLN